ncbi:MAG: ABC transporter ATP-binding protein [Hydrogenophilus sp.]|nr:ABC transporter ATP-binding protein [Hydrogenophilus sp.]
MTTDSFLHLDHLQKNLGNRPLLNDLTLHLPRGKIGCLLGPSGSGKTTLLRIIAGFTPIDGGAVRLDGQTITSPTYRLPPHARGVGMVFQDHALFPHLTVAENIAFGLRHLPAAAQRARLSALLELVDLLPFAHRYPHQLSGGQQQRVALARTLAPRPRLLLMDEPFSNLDATLRERLALDLRRILKEEGATALIVTHDQHEAFALADLLGVLEAGAIPQWDTAYALYHQPKTRFIATFIGESAFLSGTLIAPAAVATELGALRCHPPESAQPGDAVDVLLRPDDLVYDPSSPHTARLTEALFRGSIIRYTLHLPSGVQLLMDHPSHAPLPLGETIGIRLDACHVVAFPSLSAAVSP